MGPQLWLRVFLCGMESKERELECDRSVKSQFLGRSPKLILFKEAI
jgi:hypothetical protein